MIGVKIDTNAIIDGAAMYGGIIGVATTTIVATTVIVDIMRCLATMLAGRVLGLGTSVTSTIRTVGRAILPLLKTCCRDCVEQSELVAQAATDTIVGIGTTNVPTPAGH